MTDKEKCYDYYTIYSVLYCDSIQDEGGLLDKAIKEKKITTTSDRKINVGGCILVTGGYVFCGEDGSVTVHEYNCAPER